MTKNMQRSKVIVVTADDSIADASMNKKMVVEYMAEPLILILANRCWAHDKLFHFMLPILGSF